MLTSTFCDEDRSIILNKIWSFIVLCVFVSFPISCTKQNSYSLGISYKEKMNVSVKTDLSFDFESENLNSLEPYYQFPERHKKYSKSISRDELMDQIGLASSLIEANTNSFFELSSEEVKKIILEGLNIGFLLEGLNTRPLTVTTISEQDHENYLERDLLFDDVHVGKFLALILIPKVSHSSFPAILGLDGHRPSRNRFKDDFMGLELMREGFIVLMIGYRAMNLGNDEAKISEKLLLNGFSLMGIRVYETLLLLKYLLYLDEVDNERIGIIGHSGGSSITHLVVRLTPYLSAKVTDFDNDYLDMSGPIHCERIPALSYYHKTITNDSSLSIPALKVPYGFREMRENIKKFFLIHLKPYV